MQHDPYVPDLVQAQFHKVIAAAQCAELFENATRIQLTQHGQDLQFLKALKQFDHAQTKSAPMRAFVGRVELFLV